MLSQTDLLRALEYSKKSGLKNQQQLLKNGNRQKFGVFYLKVSFFKKQDKVLIALLVMACKSLIWKKSFKRKFFIPSDLNGLTKLKLKPQI